jgi:hypothetical protein
LDEVDPKTGKDVTKLVGFKDAVNFLIQSRASETPGLDSTFVHVLEPRLPGQPKLLTAVDVLHRQPAESGGGVTARLTLSAGGEAILATTLNGEKYETESLKLAGRLGVVIPKSNYLALYDGSHFSAAGWELQLEPTWKLKLLGVIGDLTGTPEESALIVESGRALPTDKRLTGHMLFVNHQANERYSTGYTIAAVSAFGAQRFRIDLKDTPPFIQHRLKAWKIDEKDPTLLFQNFRLYRGRKERNYEDRRVRFLRSGFESPMAWGSWTNVKVKQEPPPGAVQAGDAFIIYTIQPGDEAVIPSHFACTRSEAEGGRKLSVRTTGSITLKGPGRDEIKMDLSDAVDGQVEIDW